ncbi:alpha-ketoacid dehydrogenase subunit beta [Microtetraspora malaysiensis]|uniref:alpha-ketoacid dehydrogenase subunit beta n=1 Tax=Microtetraspora malaysiensis TaxID=161358 RepID=UPI000A02B73F|nr:transketolase C-terminal domain-containing protein [Microtetraspora malaysiensis]
MTRVSEHLNQALHDLMESDPAVHLLGEDVCDPYGGAFKITRGLSGRFGSRVRSTPLSEGSIVGVGAGLALAGDKAVVEIMFSDFVTLAFDQIANFAAKSTAMYGRAVPVPLIVRCPTGGNRGYGPTHSQSLQKHFIGVPGLSLFEMTPFHDAGELFARMFALGRPCLFFEDKVLYTRHMHRLDDLFRFELTGDTARIVVDGAAEPDCTLVTHGGLVHRTLDAMRTLLVEDEVVCELLVPAQLYPVPRLPGLEDARNVCVIDDGGEGGSWSAEVARVLYPRLWGGLRGPITLVNSADAVIPAAPHLEHDVLVQAGRIRAAVREAVS